MLRSEVYFLSINSFQTLTFYPISNVYIIYLQTSKQLSFKLKHRNEIVETRINIALYIVYIYFLLVRLFLFVNTEIVPNQFY